jgi:catechol 2,3-dioxygenase-like lactoylglutathione lyase family enzyme
VHLGLAAIVVDDYDSAIRFFVDALGFELVEDSPALTTKDGRPKRWVVVKPRGAVTGLLLAQADGGCFRRGRLRRGVLVVHGSSSHPLLR